MYSFNNHIFLLLIAITIYWLQMLPCIAVMTWSQLVLVNNFTHFSIFNKEYVERDEYAEVEDVNAVLHSHLCRNRGRINNNQHF